MRSKTVRAGVAQRLFTPQQVNSQLTLNPPQIPMPFYLKKSNSRPHTRQWSIVRANSATIVKNTSKTSSTMNVSFETNSNSKSVNGKETGIF